MTERFLPAVPSGGFVVAADESLAVGLQRVSLEQFDRSIDGLVGGDDVDKAVHEARKSIKRLRAVLRLVKGELSRRVYRTENEILRDTARLLAPVRDGIVMVDTVVALRHDFSSQLAPDAFIEVEAKLGQRYERRRAKALADEGMIPQVVSTLRQARARYAAWPVSEPDPYGRTPIRNTFEAIEPGLRATYGRGRAELEAAIDKPSTENFHAWRKRVKYLRHQMELLEPLWPEVVGGYASSVDRLGEIVGGEHDLAVLLHTLGELPDLAPDPAERAMVAALAQHRRKLLQAAAITLGKRVYAEPAERFVERMGAYWDQRNPQLGI
jgi:CHAD domain-containing protein